MWGVVAPKLPVRPDLPTVIALSMLAAGLVFAVLTAYSRVKLGASSGVESRYVYVVAVFTLPAIAPYSVSGRTVRTVAISSY